jgi:Mn2+/Fe2+ NRAMP family transporter
MYRILGLVGVMFGFGMQFINTTPPLLMVFSQAFQALILPAVAIPIFFLINRRSLMKDHVAGTMMNISLIIIIFYSLLTSYFAIADFF